ncbi:MAG: PQQ-binding-like beta-propeller repeat protein [Aeoliella sp.]
MRMHMTFAVCIAAALISNLSQAESLVLSGDKAPLHLVVMDPLAAPLSCPCVEGYAQRKYEHLAEYLSKQLDREVTVCFGEALGGALKQAKIDTAHIIIGKDSVIRSDAAKLDIEPVALVRLTGKEGKTTQTGLIVVRGSDSAQTAKDLSGYRILFGPPECDEKFAAARALLVDVGIEIVAAELAETSSACSDGACKIIEWGDSERAAAVISSYAAPLLEGCGTINKGDLRVVGETAPVPFVTAFVNGGLPERDQQAIGEALIAVADEPELLIALESLRGFVELGDDYPPSAEEQPAEPAKTTGEAPPGSDKAAAATESQNSGLGWTGWRGPNRDGRVRALPTRLPEKLSAVWEIPLAHAGLGGISATDKFVVIGDRNLPNTGDEFRCYDAATGQMIWMVDYPALGQLDYDNTPRATPLIHGDLVILFGAFGHLTCAQTGTGLVLWEMNVREKFGVTDEMVWGACSSPLLVDGKLIVNPGAPDASLAALDPTTGGVVWQTPGDRAGYGSLIVATFAGKQQIVGHDRTSLGGWDVETGERLWKLVPPREGDFNVPTPVVVGDHLLVTTEGNSTRLYAFDEEGKILPEPVAKYRDLAADMSTPVVVGNRAFCVCQQMFCLDVKQGLAKVWTAEDDAFTDYAPLIADEQHLLVLGHGGELLLVDAKANEYRVVSRTFLFDDLTIREAELYSHPAIVGTMLYVRGENSLACFDLE